MPDNPPLTITEIPLTSIRVPVTNNGRLTIDPQKVDRLAAEIAKVGLLHPITVTPNGQLYDLIAGNTRYLAFLKLGRPTIPAIVRQLDHAQQTHARLAENMTRAQLSPIEEALALAQMLETNPEGVEGLAAQLNRTTNWVLDRLEILDWPQEIQAAVHERKLSSAAARHLAKIQDPTTRGTYLHHAINNGITAATARQWLLETQSAQYEPQNVSENAILQPSQTISVEVRAQCNLCLETNDITNTVTLRACRTCAKLISNAQQQTPTNTR